MYDPSRYDVRVRDGLTRRARSFLSIHGLRVPSLPVDEYRDEWVSHGIPAPEVERVVAYNDRWGGIVLPPSPGYEGGPRFFSPDTPPEPAEPDGWTFWAGDQRASVPFGFMIGPKGEFGICGSPGGWVPLHATVEGWVEALALTYHARLSAKRITKLRADEVDALDLDGYEQVPEVAGMADTWWRGADSLVAIYRGEAKCLAAPKSTFALVYSGLDDWGLRGG